MGCLLLFFEFWFFLFFLRGRGGERGGWKRESERGKGEGGRVRTFGHGISLPHEVGGVGFG